MTTIDYSKKKNAELEELLRSRSLPHTGKKADLVARLQEYDNAQHSLSKKPTATTGGEDEIDWDDDAPTTVAPTVGSDPASTAAIAAGGQGPVANPVAVPNQVVDTDPSKTDDLTVDPPAPISSTAKVEDQDEAASKPRKGNEAPSTAPPTDFTSGLSITSLDDEIIKRQKRAARFNLKENDGEALKSLERAKKFGTGSTEDKTAIRGLDEALPERVKKERGVKRGRDERKEAGSEAKRRESGKRSNGRQARSTSRSKKNGSRYNRSGSRPKKVGSQKNETSERDRLASEARKKRFAPAG
ncbi:MAG: hypothetical protein Q9195_001027 [Heterodermia aff. obscurata]